MVFSEPVFLFLFLPLALGCIVTATSIGRGHCATILSFSLLFYYWSSGHFVWMLIGCVIANWALARQIERQRIRIWLLLGLAANLGTLAYFKYSYFATSNWDALMGSQLSLRFTDVALPIGISFFSFQGVSYLIDVWRGKAHAEANIFVFGAYLTFFPQLIAGPIVRYRDVISEYRAPTPNRAKAAYGARRFAHGLVKKVLVADTVAPVADTCFALAADDLTMSAAWIGAVAYAIQIYFDFSGYSDMAIGLAAICGISLRENFDRPYASSTITEFWRRWHVSLSSWFRDYLYIPLGGNRTSSIGVYRNLLLVFAATGFWHGAAWSFLAWGAYHGTFLILERLLVGRDGLARAGNLSRVLYALPVTLLGWVVFRAETLTSALTYWGAMFVPRVPHVLALPDPLLRVLTPMTAVVLLTSSLAFALPREPTMAEWLQAKSSISAEVAQLVYLVIGLLACGLIVLTSAFSPFLYFRF
ncbi:MAG: membrane-bound O-acyltransferase family protein [Deltaproteobacteria bacterium]|nr:membrane-bound O-acyltransferase family protein [Deltaproteobacteria bacterium]